jgi:hypothetical protein
MEHRLYAGVAAEAEQKEVVLLVDREVWAEGETGVALQSGRQARQILEAEVAEEPGLLVLSTHILEVLVLLLYDIL